MGRCLERTTDGLPHEIFQETVQTSLGPAIEILQEQYFQTPVSIGKGRDEFEELWSDVLFWELEHPHHFVTKF